MEGQCYNSVVSECLSPTNYESWVVEVEHYLVARNLWDIVTMEDGQSYEVIDWRQKNAAALNAILISCGPKFRSLIFEIKSAKLAWDTLAGNWTQSDEESQNETESNNYETYEPFFRAVHSGDWNKAKLFLDRHPEAVRVRTPGSGNTALQVAVAEEHINIVRELVDIMTEEEVEIVREDGFTALTTAIEVGNLDIAKCLVRKNRRLLSIYHDGYKIPVNFAVMARQKNMIHYLYSATEEEDLILPDEGRHAAFLLANCIYLQYYDIALHLVKRAPHLAIIDYDEGSPVSALAKSKVFPSGSSLNFWQQWIYKCLHVCESGKDFVTLDIQHFKDHSQKYKQAKYFAEVLLGPLRRGWSYILDLLDIKGLYQMKLFHIQSIELLNQMCKVIENTSDEAKLEKAWIHEAIDLAVEAGNVEFISGIVKANPLLVWDMFIARRLFDLAIQCRQATIFSLIYGLRNKMDIMNFHDRRGIMLHKVAALAPPGPLKLNPGAALQMQRELQWFKEVEKLTVPANQERENKDGLTPSALFTENHKNLVEEGEKWMKDTASASTIVSALIITIAFAAAFTFPGGNDQYGFPLFLNYKLYKVFMMSNAVALFTSTTSVLMFLGILTSRYGEEDFLNSLPRKLIVGLSTLFLSIAAMIIAFCAGLSLMFHNKLWILVPSICLAAIPIAFFVLMQFPLLVDIVWSTYGPSIFDRNVKRWV